MDNSTSFTAAFGRDIGTIPIAKLSAPISPAQEVSRSSLCNLVIGNQLARLVVVQAPAGFGKTTAMLQLREKFTSKGIPCGWLTIDPADNDVARFVSCISAALLNSDIDIDKQQGGFDLNSFLSTQKNPFVLFLDDFENLHESSVLAVVSSMVEMLPRGGQIILGTRTAPKLGLARLRANGQLLEVDTEQLRFSHGEAAEYLTARHKDSISWQQINALYQKTEGWAAVLWLISVSLERHGVHECVINSLSGATTEIADYLVEDILTRQTADVRTFLLKTSILRYINPSICEALLPEEDVGSLIDKVSGQNLFLESVGDNGLIYRYHSLFSTFLRNRLEKEFPQSLSSLHLVAANWYRKNGRPVPAIDHAIAARDTDLAVDLLKEHALGFLEKGRMRLLSRWFNAIPSVELINFPLLVVINAWSRLFTDGPVRASFEIDKLNSRHEDDEEIAAHINALEPMLLAMEDRYDEALALGRRNLMLIPTCSTFADSVLANAMAYVLAIMGESNEAHLLVDSARRADGDGIFNKMYAESIEGMLDLQSGRLRQASARFRIAVTANRSFPNNYSGGNAWAGLLYAESLYEVDKLSDAKQLIDVYLPQVCDIGLPDHMFIGHMILARVAYLKGDLNECHAVLNKLEALGHSRKLSRIVANARLERGRILLLQGNADGAKSEIERAIAPEVWERVSRRRLPANELDYLELSRIRWEIHFGNPHSVLRSIDAEIDESISQSRHRRALKLKTLKCLALQRCGDAASATECLAVLLKQASSEGFIRLIADEGESIGRIVCGFHDILNEMPARQSDPILLEYLSRLIAAFGSMSIGKAQTVVNSALIDPLTKKEIQVLQLVADGCSNLSLAETLKLSDSTVRTHLRNISSKLDAHSRAEAVAIARRIGIIR